MPRPVRKASEFSVTEMERRCHRALSEKRRFSKLRGATDRMIDKIKYLNRVAIGLEKGVLDPQAGKQELDQVQSELMDIVKTLRLQEPGAHICLLVAAARGGARNVTIDASFYCSRFGPGRRSSSSSA